MTPNLKKPFALKDASNDCAMRALTLRDGRSSVNEVGNLCICGTNVSVTVNPTPEAATLGLLVVGLGLVAWKRERNLLVSYNEIERGFGQ